MNALINLKLNIIETYDDDPGNMTTRLYGTRNKRDNTR